MHEILSWSQMQNSLVPSSYLQCIEKFQLSCKANWQKNTEALLVYGANKNSVRQLS